jgi:NCAIR mutase (PurE)-related protein
MDLEKLRQLLDAVQHGQITVEEALGRLRQLPYEDLGYARLDLHRPLRNAMPEVVLCEGKTSRQAISILKRLWEHHDRVLGTRVTQEMADAILKEIPEAHYEPLSRLVMLVKGEAPSLLEDAPYALVVTGGTADMPVAEEAAQTLDFLGSRVERAYDVGVAGIHRLFDQLDLIQQAAVVISVAGMEGALTSVVGGLVSCPVVGVPTSVGYGASFNGLAALLSMLNSCAAGVSVVNIDNGFGAAVVAHRILQAHKPAGHPKEQA